MRQYVTFQARTIQGKAVSHNSTSLPPNRQRDTVNGREKSSSAECDQLCKGGWVQRKEAALRGDQNCRVGQEQELTAYQRRRMNEVAEINIDMPHSHARTPARLFTPLLDQSKTSETHLSHPVSHKA